MDLTQKHVLVTGANRGLGRHLVDAFLAAGAASVRAGARRPESVDTGGDPRITPLRLDVTNPADVAAAARDAGPVDVVVNNAGVLTFGDPLTATADDLRRDIETDLIGPLLVTQAFAPTLRARRGALVNVVTLIALAPVPAMAPYCAAKAGLHSLTQSTRAALRHDGVTVFGVYPAGIDTDMLAGVESPKDDPAVVARAVIDGVLADQEDIVPPGAAGPFESYRRDPKALERMLAG